MVNEKFAAIVLIMIMALAMISAVLAEGGQDGTAGAQGDQTLAPDSESEKQMGAFNSPLGAELRLLQLEKSITLNIVTGEEIVKYIGNKTPDANVTAANEALDGLTALLDEVKATPTTGTPEELARTFVDLKNQATTLSKQFRDATKGLISKGDMPALKEQLKTLDRVEIDKLNAAIEQARKDYNAEQVTKMLTALGVTDQSLLDAVKNGTATKEQVKDAVKTAIDGMTPEQRKEALQNLKVDMTKRAVFVKAAVEKFMANRFQRESQRWDALSKKFMNKSLEAEEKGHNFTSRVMEKISDRAEVRSEWLANRSDTLRQKWSNLTQEWKDRWQNRTVPKREELKNKTPLMKDNINDKLHDLRNRTRQPAPSDGSGNTTSGGDQ